MQLGRNLRCANLISVEVRQCKAEPLKSVSVGLSSSSCCSDSNWGKYQASDSDVRTIRSQMLHSDKTAFTLRPQSILPSSYVVEVLAVVGGAA